VIEERYFRHNTRTQEEFVEVMKALSVHGSDGHTHLRHRIAASYAVLLDAHPAMVSYVAKGLLAWQRWDFTDVLSKIPTAQADVDPRSLSFTLGHGARSYLRWPAKENLRHRLQRSTLL
jgi:hypothetical protein